MASEAAVLIFSALFPETNGNIPPDKAAIVPDLLSHIQAMESLVQHGRGEKHKAQYRSIRDPRLSALITDRIMELHGKMGPDWKGIACTIAQEFHKTLSIDGVRGRYKSRAAQLEAHAAMSGEVFSREPSTILPPVGPTDGPGPEPGPVRTSPEPEELPKDLPTDPPADSQPATVANNKDGNINCRDGAGRQEDCAAPRSAAIPNVHERSNVATKSPFGEYPANFEAVPIPLKEQEVDESDMAAIKAEVLARHAKGEGIKNIAEALGVRWQWVRAVCAKAPKPEQEDKSEPSSEKVLPSEPPAESTQSAIIHEPPAAQSISRADLDAKIWNLHRAGKNPEEISDALYSEGLYYSEKSVRVRLISQGAKL